MALFIFFECMGAWCILGCYVRANAVILYLPLRVQKINEYDDDEEELAKSFIIKAQHQCDAICSCFTATGLVSIVSNACNASK